MEDLVKELTIDMVPDGDNRIIAETIGVENYYKRKLRYFSKGIYTPC